MAKEGRGGRDEEGVECRSKAEKTDGVENRMVREAGCEGGVRRHICRC